MAVAKLWNGSAWVRAIVGAKGDKGDPGIVIDEGSGAADGDVLVYDANWDVWVPQQPETPGIWQDWTPTLTGITLGNGTQTARYTRIGNTVFVRYLLVFGSTTSISSASTSLPVPAASNPFQYGTSNDIETVYNSGGVVYHNGSTDSWVGFASVVGGISQNATFYVHRSDASTNLGKQSSVSATSPFTFGTDSVIAANFSYEAA